MNDDTPDFVSLHAAQSWLRRHIDKGAKCPCCHQFSKVYRRTINSSMAFGLIEFYRHHRTDWGHAPSTGAVAQLGGEFARLELWGLVKEAEERREDGGRVGWWRITDKGIAFLRNEIRVPKYAKIYDGRLLDLDYTTMVSITDALGTKFNYRDLMGDM